MHRLVGWVALVFLASSCLIVDGSFHDKHIDGLWLTVADNPTLRVGYGDGVEGGQKTIALTVPNYFDASHAVLHIDWTGEILRVNGTEVSGPTVTVDLSLSLVLSVAGKDREFREYQVETTAVAPSSVKTVSLWPWAGRNGADLLIPENTTANTDGWISGHPPSEQFGRLFRSPRPPGRFPPSNSS